MKCCANTPAKQYSQPGENARVVRFPTSDEVSFMHGSTVDVGGGTVTGSLLG